MTEYLDASKNFNHLRQIHASDLNMGDRVATREGQIFEVESTIAQGERILGCRLNPVKDTDKSGWGGTVNHDPGSSLDLNPDDDLQIRKLEK